jgi:glycosyltransferase involved in cell wall biosynthesis
METVSKFNHTGAGWGGGLIAPAPGLADVCITNEAEAAMNRRRPSQNGRRPADRGSQSRGEGHDRLKIALVSTPFLAVPPHNYGGTELIIYELAEGLVKAGHEVVLFATGDSQSSGELRSLYATPQWPPNPFVDLNHASWAMQQTSLEDFDVVHAHSAVALALGRLVADVPLVYTLHHPPVEDFSKFYEDFPEVHYVAISERQMELETQLPHCTVIHHGLDASRFQCTDQPEDYVCFVGRYSDVKGPHTAIDAAQKAGVPIRVAGEVHWPDREFAERELNARLQLPHVTELGCINVAKKVPLLRNARALLTPITWEEPFGLIIIEAMLSGCPVVSFPCGSAPELIENGVTGYLVKDLEEMAEVIRPGGVLDQFDRHRCRSIAEKLFGSDRLIADHVRVYQAAIKNRRSARVVHASV